MKWVRLIEKLPPLKTPVLVAEYCEMFDEIYIQGEYAMSIISTDNSEITLGFDEDFLFNDAKNIYWTKDFTRPKKKK